METSGTPTTASDIATRLLTSVETVVRGKTEEIRLVVTALVCGRHVLLEDVPGRPTGLARTEKLEAMPELIDRLYKRPA